MSSPYPQKLSVLVESYLKSTDFSFVTGAEGLGEAMRYSLLAGGKRIRPVLCLAAARAVGVEPEKMLPTASALEMIHTFSLIHDDLPSLDNDDLRRGQASSHIRFSEGVAVLAGDALFAQAFTEVIHNQVGTDKQKLSIVGDLADAVGLSGMVAGQFIDITGDADSAEALQVTHAAKTGRLIMRSVTAGTRLADLAESEIAAFESFATQLGVLFQIADDILDVTGSEEELGKPIGSDQKLEKKTYVSLFGLNKAEELARERYDSALRNLDQIAGDTTGLVGVTESVFLTLSAHYRKFR